MKFNVQSLSSQARRKGWALLITMTLTACAAMVMAGVLSWSNNSSWIIARNNEYYQTSYAAEAATEKALAGIIQDYENYGEATVFANLSTYSNNVPSASDDSVWGNYIFCAASGQTNKTSINMISSTNLVWLSSPYQGLYMLAFTYQIVSTCSNSASGFGINAAVGQQVNLGLIPIFQFAIFYQNTMEIDPGANMSVNGLVHGNSPIYMDPNSGVVLTFSNDVSSSSLINLSENPLDPSGRPATSNPTFYGTNEVNVNPLVLPVGTNSSGSVSNMSQNVDAILQIPPAGLSASLGSNYLYNQADIIVLVSNNSVFVTSGVAVNNQATVISNSQWSVWLSTNVNTQFTDQRDQLLVQTTDIDVGKLVSWSRTNTVLRPALSSERGAGAADVQSIFVADLRTTSNAVITTNISYTTNNVFTNTTPSLSYPVASSYLPPVATNTVLTTTLTKPANGTYVGSYTGNGTTGYIYQKITGYSYQLITGVVTNYAYTTNWNIISQAGVVLTNGVTLPPQGLSLVTPDPAYIVGNYNVGTNGTAVNTGTHNTSQTYPAAVYSDAITILSSAWNPANSAASIGSRGATSDTVNAAFLTGNVPSDGTTYSGGVENFPRFLEDWGGQIFTYNGSMVCMFNSQVATAPWPGTGTVYNPPTRNWAFDLNFTNPAKLPPLTPRVIYVNRAEWSFVNPYATSF